MQRGAIGRRALLRSVPRRTCGFTALFVPRAQDRPRHRVRSRMHRSSAGHARRVHLRTRQRRSVLSPPRLRSLCACAARTPRIVQPQRHEHLGVRLHAASRNARVRDGERQSHPRPQRRTPWQRMLERRWSPMHRALELPLDPPRGRQPNVVPAPRRPRGRARSDRPARATHRTLGQHGLLDATAPARATTEQLRSMVLPESSALVS